MANINDLEKIWDREAKNYRFENENQPDYLANFYHIKKCLGKLKGMKTLEVGSGAGQGSAFLAAEGASVYLVDISKIALSFAKKYFSSKKLKGKFLKQNAFKMKFVSESFDYVWNGGVIEHFSDKEKILMIKQMWKLVKPGGKLLIMVPNARDIPFFIAKKILILRDKWPFGQEDDMTIEKMNDITKAAGILKFKLYSYNPIVGFWFFPYGREIMDTIGLNTAKKHGLESPFGHVIVLCAKK